MSKSNRVRRSAARRRAGRPRKVVVACNNVASCMSFPMAVSAAGVVTITVVVVIVLVALGLVPAEALTVLAAALTAHQLNRRSR
ncbi:hypothetical protein [Streptomyces tauricus]|uniref:hypothetical protein n=1 Tax=Streptomyces tauricus TaxID=68274 RepID=UPI002242FD37|nr:hypothetical protein [Streptomyces tauricus]MCW8103015.1 hypothetical protein [Streptomyces tauricus]